MGGQLIDLFQSHSIHSSLDVPEGKFENFSPMAFVNSSSAFGPKFLEHLRDLFSVTERMVNDCQSVSTGEATETMVYFLYSRDRASHLCYEGLSP